MKSRPFTPLGSAELYLVASNSSRDGLSAILVAGGVILLAVPAPLPATAQSAQPPPIEGRQLPSIMLAQGSTGRPLTPEVVPTDILPLRVNQNQTTFAENLTIRALQKLPAPLFINASAETTLRYESNPFQFPKRSALRKNLPTDAEIARLSDVQRGQIFQLLGRVNDETMVFRVLPNVTVGWQLGNGTRVYSNSFMLKDQYFKHPVLNTTICSVGGGLQHDIPIGTRSNLQVDAQFRELFQRNVQPQFDYLPSLTYTYFASPRLVLFANTVLQLRGKKPFQSPTKEIDPFYSFGGLYRRGNWRFTTSATLVQNFREPFGRNAIVRQDNYSWICDFEVARRIMRQLPLEWLVRAEPIWNFHSNQTPGLSGFDFRLFFGIRGAVSKRPLTSMIEQMRNDIMEQELERQLPEEKPGTKPGTTQPGKPNKPTPSTPKPSASNPQQISQTLEEFESRGIDLLGSELAPEAPGGIDSQKVELEPRISPTRIAALEPEAAIETPEPGIQFAIFEEQK